MYSLLLPPPASKNPLLLSLSFFCFPSLCDLYTSLLDLGCWLDFPLIFDEEVWKHYLRVERMLDTSWSIIWARSLLLPMLYTHRPNEPKTLPPPKLYTVRFNVVPKPSMAIEISWKNVSARCVDIQITVFPFLISCCLIFSYQFAVDPLHEVPELDHE